MDIMNIINPIKNFDLSKKKKLIADAPIYLARNNLNQTQIRRNLSLIYSKIFLIFSLIFFWPCLANAKIKFYVGGDVQIQMLDFKMKKSIVVSESDPTKTTVPQYNLYPSKILMPNVFLGLDIAEKIKLEVGYSKRIVTKIGKEILLTVPDKQPISTRSTLKTEIISFDFKVYDKFDQHLTAYLIFGVSRYQFGIKEKLNIDGTGEGKLYSYSEQKKKSKLSPGIGLGAEYQINPSFFARIQVKYNYLSVKTPDIKYGAEKIRSATNLNFGAGYYF